MGVRESLSVGTGTAYMGATTKRELVTSHKGESAACYLEHGIFVWPSLTRSFAPVQDRSLVQGS